MADSKPRYGTCFNPFKLANHVKKDRKRLRRVLPAYLLKLKIPITPASSKYFICDTCRIKITRIPVADENNRHARPSGSSASNLKNVGTVSTSTTNSTENDPDVLLITVSSESVMNFNKSSITLTISESPATKRCSKVLKNCSSERLGKIGKTMNEKLFEVEDDDEKDGIDQEHCTVLRFKEYCNTAKDRNLKIRILNVLES